MTLKGNFVEEALGGGAGEGPEEEIGMRQVPGSASPRRESVLDLELGLRVLGHLEAENCDLGEGRLTWRLRTTVIWLRASSAENVCAPAA